MAAHSVLSPSSAHRWIPCPGSIALSRDIPERAAGEHAAEGTAAHELAEWCLRTGKDANARLGEEIRVDSDDGLQQWTFTVDDDMAAHVQSYVDDARRQGGDLLVEQRVDLSAVLGVEDQGGTADAVIIEAEPGLLEIRDLKYGRGVQVYAERNEQLMLYGVGALEQYDMLGDFDRVRLTIHQPRLDHLDSWDIDADELREWAANEARGAAALALSDEAELHLHPGEKQCRWCPAKASCPALAAAVTEPVFENYDDLFDDLTAEPELKHSGDAPDDAAVLARARTLVPMIEDWCKAVVAEVDRRLAVGEDVPGWKLVEGRRGARQWADEEEAEQQLKRWRMKKDEMYSMKLITPTQAQKVLTPNRWEKAQELITQKEGKPQAVPDTDSRPALQSESFDDLTGD